MNPKIIAWQLVFLLFCVQASGQNTDSLIHKLMSYIHAISNFSKAMPQEKVYLHFDNTSYYQGDNIWFKCYVKNSELHETVQLSKTLYVELLNPGGEVIGKRILKIENGQCHGDFSLNRLPFYSGFYEVRAYTKYMLNFGEDAIFSRLLPVFDKPKEDGNFEEKNMLRYGRYGTRDYPMKREPSQKGKKVNLTFFPEGGNLVRDVESRVAFEATDELGNPIEVTGAIVNKAKEEIVHFSATHEGRGVFDYTPGSDDRKAIIDYNGKKYQFDMPVTLSQGIVLKTDNLSYPDSIGIALQKNKDTPAGMVGMAVIGRGKLKNCCIINIPDNETVRYKIDKTKLPSGVSQIVLFDMNGDILCDRLIFVNKRDEIFNFNAKTEKRTYEPHELVNMEFSVTDDDENPVPASFSLSVKDGMGEIEHKHNIMTYFLLTSEIKGYVRNPSYYFESDDEKHSAELDLLLMVQGWRRHMWGQMAGTEPLNLKYMPEQGIETLGQVVSMARSIPKPGVDISFFLHQKEGDDIGNFAESFVTDGQGQFAFVSDVSGRWDMILSVKEKGKKKDHRIILDRLFSPDPRKYQYVEMHADIIDIGKINLADERPGEEMTDIPDTDIDSIYVAHEDLLENVGIDQKIHRLSEVVVTAKKKRNRERDIYNNRSKSVAYYDVHSELDDIKDRNKFVGNDIHELMLNMNENFTRLRYTQQEYLKYKGKIPLFVINYERTMATEMDYNKYKLIRIEAIKSIYINEILSIKCQYADFRLTPLQVDGMYSCVVFIETYPDGMIPAEVGKGVRKTKLEGYNQPTEFYNPDYSALPPEPDYRRTLYWNPSVTPNEYGRVNVQFYNNSRCRRFNISAETVTMQGLIGTYKNE